MQTVRTIACENIRFSSLFGNGCFCRLSELPLNLEKQKNVTTQKLRLKDVNNAAQTEEGTDAQT